MRSVDMCLKIATEENLFLSVVQSMPDPVLLLDRHSDIVVFANLAARMRWPSAMAGRTLADVVGDHALVVDLLRRARLTGREFSLSDASFQFLATPGVTEGVDMLLSRSAQIPASVRKNEEWVSRVRNTLRPARLMARMLAHEIRNPLSGIRGAAQLLRQSVLSADDRELLSLIENETARILRLTEKVDAFDAPETVAGRAVNLHAVLDGVARAARKGFAAKVSIEQLYDPSLPDVEGDADALAQVFLNIVKNAVEAEGAAARRVVLRTGYEVTPTYHPETRRKLPVFVSVEDNGNGIAPEGLPHLFDLCYTTKESGEGLGLAIVSKIVDAHGGIVDVSSVPGQTVFKVCFPRMEEAAS